MDDNRVATVLFYFFIDQGQGDNYIVEYIMVNGKGEYTRRQYNISEKRWSYQLEWYQTTAKSEFEEISTECLCKWYFRNINIPTVPHIFENKDIRKIPVEFAKYLDNDGE